MKIIILFFLLIVHLNADETLTKLFHQLNKTPQKEKYRVMNDIKQHIVQLKQTERVEAIKVLQTEKKIQNSSTSLCRATVPTKDETPTPSTTNTPHNNEKLLSKNMSIKMQTPMQNISTMQNMPMMREIKDKRNNRPNPPINHPSSERNSPNPMRK